MTARAPLHLFGGFGVELEFMIVDGETLAVLPAADAVMQALAGEFASEVELGDLRLSNELVLHVLELKTSGPVASLEGLSATFQEGVRRLNDLLRPMGGALMPSGMHPWMDPRRETRLWPHQDSEVYRAFDRIFDCRSHGWSNLQGAHLNLPFAGDEEFARLHAAVRLILPILPALAASSPIVEGQVSPLLDSRIGAYGANARELPSIAGGIVPEPVFSVVEYRSRILERLYSDIAPHDPEGILQQEWLNSRGAIARLERQSIEIRVVDMQDCPLADLAILQAVVLALEALVEERWGDLAAQQSWGVEPLASILQGTTREGEQALIHDPAYRECFGLYSLGPCTAGELWQHIVAALAPAAGESEPDWLAPLRKILREGCLARRILAALPQAPTPEALRAVYRELCACLAAGRMF